MRLQPFPARLELPVLLEQQAQQAHKGQLGILAQPAQVAPLETPERLAPVAR